MKKRLRKKKHYGEFAEYGRQLIITRVRKDGIDDFIDSFLEDAIEANSCFYAGCVNDVRLDFIVELGTRSDYPESKINKIKTWLKSRPDVLSWTISQEFDLWYGDVENLKKETEYFNQHDCS